MHAGLRVHVLCACVLNISLWSFILYCIVQQHWCSHYHTCLPQNCVFRNKNHQNPEHSIIFWNTSANVSPHLWKRSGYQILQENHGATYIVHLPYAVCHSCSTVCQFNHFTTLLQTSEFTQVSPFSSMVTKGNFSWYNFSERFGNVSFSLKTVLQVHDP